MCRWIAWFVLLTVPAYVAGCPTGRSPLTRRDAQWAPDGPVPLDLRLDSQADLRRRADIQQRPSDTQRLSDVPHPDVKPQGTSCTSNGVQLSASASPKPCGTVDLTAQAGTGYTWVLGGVKDAQGKVTWMPPTSVTPSPCCTWEFRGLPVPCAGAVGPFSFNLMKDATDDNPTVGSIAASCIP
jgi:hypothetical protein